MKVLITGVAGQLGGALVAAAPDMADIVALDRHALDLTDEAAIRATVKESSPDLVINAAAYTAVDKAEAEAGLAHRINAVAPGIFAQALAENSGRLVQISTDFVFDGMATQAYQPSDRRNPISVYGESKSAGEDAAGDQALIVRTSWVYAAGGGNFVRTMLRLMRERDALSVVSDQIGAPTWATGLARSIWGLVRDDASGVFHHCDAGIASWYDFAVAIKEEAMALDLIECDIPITPIPSSDYPTPAKRPAFSVLDCSTTRAQLGNGHKHWRENLRLMLKEEQALG